MEVIAAKLLSQLTRLCFFWHTDMQSGSRSVLTLRLVVGLVVGVAAIIRQRRDGQVFALLMLAMMLLPDLLTYEKHDHTAVDFNRLLAAIPFVFVAAGLGSATIWAWLESRPRLPGWTGYLVLALALIFSMSRQWDYTTRVQPLLQPFQATFAGYGRIAEYVGSRPDQPVLLPTTLYSFPAFAFMLAEQFPLRQGWLPESLRAGENVTVILPNAQWDRTDWVKGAAVQGEWVLLKDKTASFFPPASESFALLNDAETPILGPGGVEGG